MLGCLSLSEINARRCQVFQKKTPLYFRRGAGHLEQSPLEKFFRAKPEGMGKHSMQLRSPRALQAAPPWPQRGRPTSLGRASASRPGRPSGPPSPVRALARRAGDAKAWSPGVLTLHAILQLTENSQAPRILPRRKVKLVEVEPNETPGVKGTAIFGERL